MTAEINGVSVPLQPGEMLVWRGGEIFSATQDPDRPQTSLSACLSLSRDDATNVLLQHRYQRHYRLEDRKSYEQNFQDVVDALDSQSRWRNLHVTAAMFHWLAYLQESLAPEPERPGATRRPCTTCILRRNGSDRASARTSALQTGPPAAGSMWIISLACSNLTSA